MTACAAFAKTNRIFIIAWLLFLVGSSCAPRKTSEPVIQVATATHTLEIPSVTPSLTHTYSPTPSSTSTITPTATETPTATSEPTYAILRGEVLELANCRYGPGAPYLYKYGLVAGSNLEIIGRNDPGTWILIQAIGGNNPCWVKASLMNIKGDVMSVAPIKPEDVVLPQSPYYGPPTGVFTQRNGNDVTVSWDAVTLRAGDDSEQFPYLVEAWVCKNGQLVFTPVGSTATTATVTDESGCPLPSHGRLYAVEKHGYTNWIKIPWPPNDATPTPTP